MRSLCGRGKITDVKFKLELKHDFEPKSSAPRAHGLVQTKFTTAWIKEQAALGWYEPAGPYMNPDDEQRLAKVNRQVNDELRKVPGCTFDQRHQAEADRTSVLRPFLHDGWVQRGPAGSCESAYAESDAHLAFPTNLTPCRPRITPVPADHRVSEAELLELVRSWCVRRQDEADPEANESIGY